jgi:YD repeat-containing protein
VEGDAGRAEQTIYQYDELKRLVSATGQPAYTYDGFGNLTGMGAPVDPDTNRIATYTYDANGNVTGMPQMTLEYDAENRIVRATHQTNGVDEYGYDPANQRVWKNGESPTTEWTASGWAGTCWGGWGQFRM